MLKMAFLISYIYNKYFLRFNSPRTEDRLILKGGNKRSSESTYLSKLNLGCGGMINLENLSDLIIAFNIDLGCRCHSGMFYNYIRIHISSINKSDFIGFRNSNNI